MTQLGSLDAQCHSFRDMGWAQVGLFATGEPPNLSLDGCLAEPGWGARMGGGSPTNKVSRAS